MEATIISTDQGSVTIERERDHKKFTLKLETLSKESIAIIDAWKVAQTRLPTVDYSYNIDWRTLRRPAQFTFGFKLPKYDYGTNFKVIKGGGSPSRYYPL